MTYFCTLASGSVGNVSLYRSGKETILIDAGRTAKYICQQLAELGLKPEDLTRILITHSHRDHVSALAVLLKRTQAELWCSHETCDAIRKQIPAQTKVHFFYPGDSFYLGDCLIDTFQTIHDAAGSCGFVLGEGEKKAAVCTDLGVVTTAVRHAIEGSRAVLLESNHDVEMLCHGPYPYPLKKRILSDQGHLSNETAGEFAAELCRSGTKFFLLGHLSEHNNTEECAYETVTGVLERENVWAQVYVAPADTRSKKIILEDEQC